MRSLARHLLLRLLQSWNFRRMLAGEFADLLQPASDILAADVPLAAMPAAYRSGSPEVSATQVKAPDAPVFITARFRSGSTFLWQLMRAIPGITAYYEPLNERRWFLPEKARHGVDATHIGVSDYAAEYSGMEELAATFDTAWNSKRLFMGPRHQDRMLENYIAELIRRAPGRPVLQFNRVDFRLGWLRAHFPQARLLHLYRNPREQWLSVMGVGDHVPPMDPRRPFDQYRLFYTLQWADDLQRIYPFLASGQVTHPYALHYYLWRLSYSHGVAYSDLSVAYEDLTEHFDATMSSVLRKFDLPLACLPALAGLNHASGGLRWRSYADDAWFSRIEDECDRNLAIYHRTI